jgi:hypothetical protein
MHVGVLMLWFCQWIHILSDYEFLMAGYLLLVQYETLFIYLLYFNAQQIER